MHGHHLIVGGQRSGKSRHAQALAQRWLQQSPQHRVTVLATALAADDEMRARIAQHQRERPADFDTAEAPLALAQAVRLHSEPGRLLLIDCLTLWLTNWLMPAQGDPAAGAWDRERGALLSALNGALAPVLLVSNEVGWGIVPMSRDVRFFVDELGRLNQAVASCCDHLTLMVAGQAWTREVQE